MFHAVIAVDALHGGRRFLHGGVFGGVAVVHGIGRQITGRCADGAVKQPVARITVIQILLPVGALHDITGLRGGLCGGGNGLCHGAGGQLIDLFRRSSLRAQFVLQFLNFGLLAQDFDLLGVFGNLRVLAVLLSAGG